MALVFPRAMPAAGIGQQVFEAMQINMETAEAGGALYGVSVGLKRWRAEWTLAAALQQTDSDEWSAFIASLDGAKRTFLGADIARPFPKLYPNGFAGLIRAGGGAFDGSFTSWSQTITADGQALLTLNGAPAGFALSTRDYVGLRWTTSSIQRRHKVRALEGGVANGSGVIAGLTVDPPVHVTVVPGSAVAHVDNPSCVMRIIPSQTQVTEMDRRARIGAKIVALQDIRP